MAGQRTGVKREWYSGCTGLSWLSSPHGTMLLYDRGVQERGGWKLQLLKILDHFKTQLSPRMQPQDFQTDFLSAPFVQPSIWNTGGWVPGQSTLCTDHSAHGSQ